MSYAIVFGNTIHARIVCLCDRCGHQWLLKRGKDIPERCANAKYRCYDWNKGEVESIVQRDRAKFREIQAVSIAAPARDLTIDYSESQ